MSELEYEMYLDLVFEAQERGIELAERLADEAAAEAWASLDIDDLII